MAQTARTTRASQGRGPLGLLGPLGDEGRAHPVESVLAGVALLLGAVALLTGLLTQFEVADLHLVASWVGLVGVLAAGWGQYVSVTLGERFALILGLGASAFGLFLGFAYGGPFGGVLG